MKVVVTGASGFVGSHLIEALRQAGHSVRGLSRREPTGARRHPGVEYVGGVDVNVSTSLTREMFDDAQAVVHLVGIIQEAPRDGQTFQRIHVYGTQNVLDAADRAGVPGRFIYMSALGSSPGSPSEYSRTKFAAEQAVQKSSLPYTIFRPSLILGRDGEFVEQMGDLVKHGGLHVNIPFPFIPVPGSGENKFQPVWIDDLTACVVKSLTLPQTAGQTYEIGGATQVSFNDMLSGFARGLNVQKKMVHAPVPMMKVAAAVMEAVLPKPPVTRDQLANLGSDNITNSRAITEVFGVQPLPFDQILAQLYSPSMNRPQTVTPAA